MVTVAAILVVKDLDESAQWIDVEGLEENCQLTDLTQSRNVSQMIKQ